MGQSCVAIAIAILLCVGGMASAQEIDHCGYLESGVEAGCILFVSVHYGEYLVLEGLGGFNVGDFVRVVGTLVQPCVTYCMQGDGCITNYTISACGSCCIGITGNVDNDPDEIIDIGDVAALLEYLYIRPGVEPPKCIPEANVDGDPGGIVDIGDVTALLNYLYIRPGVELPAECP